MAVPEPVVALETLYELRRALFHPDFRLPIEIPHRVRDIGRGFRNVTGQAGLQLYPGRLADRLLELRDEVADILAVRGREIAESVSRLVARAKR